MDKRLFADKECGLKLETPSWLEGDEDEADWMDGLEVLNEIATETLAQDVMKNLGHKNKWFAPIAGISGLEMRFMATYKKGLSKSEKIFGGRDKFEKFRQNLILAMLTGDNKTANDQLEGLGYQNVDRFALEIGREAKYSSGLGLEWSIALVDVNFPGIISINLSPHSPSLINIGAAVFEIEQLSAGIENPTIVGIAFAFLAFNGFFAINPAILSQHGLVHETCHYLSQNTGRFGLEKWKK